jgi:hypothetical protein
LEPDVLQTRKRKSPVNRVKMSKRSPKRSKRATATTLIRGIRS